MTLKADLCSLSCPRTSFTHVVVLVPFGDLEHLVISPEFITNGLQGSSEKQGENLYASVVVPIIAIHMAFEVDIIHWTWSWTTCSKWLYLSRAIGQGDLQRSLPTSTIPWSCKIHLPPNQRIRGFTYSSTLKSRKFSVSPDTFMFSFINKCWRYGWISKLHWQKHRRKINAISAVLYFFQSFIRSVEGCFLLFPVMVHFFHFSRKLFSKFQDLACCFLPIVFNFFTIFLHGIPSQ